MASSKGFGDSELTLGLISGSIGFISNSLIPSYSNYGIGLMGLGAFCIYHYFTHRSVFDKVFKTLDLGIKEVYPLFKRKTKKDGYVLYEYTLPAGMSIEDFENNKERIELFIRKRLEFDYGFKNLLIKVFPWKEIEKYDYEPISLKGDVELIIGYDRLGKMITVDLSQGEPHLLCAGESGGGIVTGLIAS